MVKIKKKSERDAKSEEKKSTWEEVGYILDVYAMIDELVDELNGSGLFGGDVYKKLISRDDNSYNAPTKEHWDIREKVSFFRRNRIASIEPVYRDEQVDIIDLLGEDRKVVSILVGVAGRYEPKLGEITIYTDWEQLFQSGQ